MTFFVSCVIIYQQLKNTKNGSIIMLRLDCDEAFLIVIKKGLKIRGGYIDPYGLIKVKIVKKSWKQGEFI